MLLRAAFKQRPIRAKYMGRAVKGGLPGRVYLLPHGAGPFFFTIKMHSAKKAHCAFFAGSYGPAQPL